MFRQVLDAATVSSLLSARHVCGRWVLSTDQLSELHRVCRRISAVTGCTGNPEDAMLGLTGLLAVVVTEGMLYSLQVEWSGSAVGPGGHRHDDS